MNLNPITKPEVLIGGSFPAPSLWRGGAGPSSGQCEREGLRVCGDVPVRARVELGKRGRLVLEGRSGSGCGSGLIRYFRGEGTCGQRGGLRARIRWRGGRLRGASVLLPADAKASLFRRAPSSRAGAHFSSRACSRALPHCSCGVGKGPLRRSPGLRGRVMSGETVG